MANNTNTHVVLPTAMHIHTVIFLHGRGSNATEFASEFFESQDSADCFFPDIFPSTKWVFPCAAERWATTENEIMHQWFDMASVQRPSEQSDIQKQGLRESISFVLDVLEEEMKSVPANCIFLAGISQGCATAILALLCSGVRLGGFIGLSSWLPYQKEILSTRELSVDSTLRIIQTLIGLEYPTLETGKTEAALKTPVFLSHSEDDEVVPIANGQGLAEGLLNLGMQVRFERYVDGGHWVNEPKGVDDIITFIKRHSMS